MFLNQSPEDPTAPTAGAGSGSNPLNGLRKMAVKFHAPTPAATDPTTGISTPASGPEHGIAEISLESHAPEKAVATPPTPPPQTKLDPLSEALFPHWMRANGIDPDSTTDHHYDYRGVYKQTDGQVHPPGTLSGVADKFNQLQNTQPAGLQGLMGAGGQAMPPLNDLVMRGQLPANPMDAVQPIPNSPANLGGGGDPLRELLTLLGQRNGGQ